MTTDRISDAIVVHGPGRSGTTLLYNILALHPALAWVSGYVDRFPHRPDLSLLNRAQDIAAVERWSRDRRRWPRPAEAYGFWDAFFPGFSAAESRPAEGSPTDRPDECIRAIRAIMAYSNKPRFITKLTGLSRAAELERVFDNSYVLYINRDPRAVVMSSYKQRWGYKRRPEAFAATDTRDLLDEYVARYRRSVDEARLLERFRFLPVRYEDVVADPARAFGDIMAFTGLPRDGRFDQVVASWSFRGGTSRAWREQLLPDEADYLDVLLADECGRWGYEAVG